MYQMKKDLLLIVTVTFVDIFAFINLVCVQPVIQLMDTPFIIFVL